MRKGKRIQKKIARARKQGATVIEKIDKGRTAHMGEYPVTMPPM